MNAGADLFVEPMLVLAIAKVQRGTATWDDMRIELRKATFSEKLDVFGSSQAGVSALSLRVLVRNRQGSILEDGRTGLRMLVRQQTEGYERIPITEWLGDPELNWSTVERAVQPLLMRLQGDVPNAPGPTSGRSP